MEKFLDKLNYFISNFSSNSNYWITFFKLNQIIPKAFRLGKRFCSTTSIMLFQRKIVQIGYQRVKPHCSRPRNQNAWLKHIPTDIRVYVYVCVCVYVCLSVLCVSAMTLGWKSFARVVLYQILRIGKSRYSLSLCRSFTLSLCLSFSLSLSLSLPISLRSLFRRSVSLCIKEPSDRDSAAAVSSLAGLAHPVGDSLGQSAKYIQQTTNA